jgi:hypothetical protein
MDVAAAWAAGDSRNNDVAVSIRRFRANCIKQEKPMDGMLTYATAERLGPRAQTLATCASAMASVVLAAPILWDKAEDFFLILVKHGRTSDLGFMLTYSDQPLWAYAGLGLAGSLLATAAYQYAGASRLRLWALGGVAVNVAGIITGLLALHWG